MNEEYLRGLHNHLGIEDDYETWINAVSGNDEYLRGLHGHIGVEDDYDTWRSSVFGEPVKKKRRYGIIWGGRFFGWER
jgi:hypothetical protein